MPPYLPKGARKHDICSIQKLHEFLIDFLIDFGSILGANLAQKASQMRTISSKKQLKTRLKKEDSF